mgnify:CR=1 FL=1
MDVWKRLKLFNGGDVYQCGSPLGGAMVVHEVSQMIAKGFGRVATVGAFSTGVGGGAAAIIDLDQPQLAVAVPTGYTIRPVRISVQVQGGLAATDNDETEILVAVDPYGQWTGDGTFTAELPINMRTDLGQGSACRVGSAFSADMTTTPAGAAAADPVLDMELARKVNTLDISTIAGLFLHELSLVYEPLHGPFIVGPATLLVYWGGTVEPTGGFCQAAWVEGRNEEFYVRV